MDTEYTYSESVREHNLMENEQQSLYFVAVSMCQRPLEGLEDIQKGSFGFIKRFGGLIQIS